MEPQESVGNDVDGDYILMEGWSLCFQDIHSMPLNLIPCFCFFCLSIDSFKVSSPDDGYDVLPPTRVFLPDADEESEQGESSIDIVTDEGNYLAVLPGRLSQKL